MKTQFVKNSTSQRCSIFFDLAQISGVDHVPDLDMTQEQRLFSHWTMLKKEQEGTTTSLYYLFGVIRTPTYIPRNTKAIVQNKWFAECQTIVNEDQVFPRTLSPEIDIRKYTTATPTGGMTSIIKLNRNNTECIAVHLGHASLQPVLQYSFADNAHMDFIKRIQKLEKNERSFLVTNMKLREYYKISS